MAAAADSDQEDWIEEAYGNDPNLQNLQQDEEGGFQRMTSNPNVNFKGESPIKKKRKFYYYALVFDVEFEDDQDIVYFAFSTPYSYSQVVSEILDKEEEIKPSQQSHISAVPRKVIGQNP